MNISWTTTQRQRLIELDADLELLKLSFEDTQQRDQAFRQLDKELVFKNKTNLMSLKNSGFRPSVSRLEIKLADRLIQEGFVQVSTPIILAKGMLEKMTITSEHPLAKQVFWLDNNKCLRPMLAPNLYYLFKDLLRLWGKPIKIFEIGPCFRKESQGAHHLNEFTMLNLVEVGIPEGQQKQRLQELISITMDCAGLSKYKIETSESEVYGETLDVIYKDLELCSGAFGPHKLDEKWGVLEPWVGVGFGLERLAMVTEGYNTIRRVGRSLAYLDGSRLNI